MPSVRRLPSTTAPQLTITVTAYSEDALAEALSNEDWVDATAIRQRQQFVFFREYLGADDDGLHALTMVSEWPYVSQSYLEDYADYYARCFAPYERDCKRIHFFGASFTEQELLEALPLEEHAIWDSYLGYVVVKPLPAPIGATLLRPYANGEQKERRYPVQRPYHVNLLGKRLTVPTLVFQQQDTNVSACATTALWMAFHKTAFLFQTPLPSPYRITESAGNLFNHSGRTFPNRGLDAFQIMTAIASVGLVSEMRNQFIQPRGMLQQDALQQLRRAKAFIYAYLRMGLPVLLFIDIENRGGHLVAATGYREPKADYTYSESENLALVSDGIERMYVHDDGIGPYSRLGFDDITGLLSTAWPHNGDWSQREMAWLFTTAVPIVSDVRIQYEQVYEQAARLNDLLHFLRPVYATETAPVVWDLYLQYSNVHKEESLSCPHGTAAQRQRVATCLLPKYVWVARALYQGKPLLELVFDATDLHTGFYCLLTTTYEPLRKPLTQLLPADTFQGVLRQALDSRYVGLLLDDLGLIQPVLPEMAPDSFPAHS